jgi:hypothetical protein
VTLASAWCVFHTHRPAGVRAESWPPAGGSSCDSAAPPGCGCSGSSSSPSWFGLGYRLFQIQVVQAEEFQAGGLTQRLETRTLAPDGDDLRPQR